MEQSVNPAVRVGHYTRTVSTSTQNTSGSCSAEWQCFLCVVYKSDYLLTYLLYISQTGGDAKHTARSISQLPKLCVKISILMHRIFNFHDIYGDTTKWAIDQSAIRTWPCKYSMHRYSILSQILGNCQCSCLIQWRELQFYSFKLHSMLHVLSWSCRETCFYRLVRYTFLPSPDLSRLSLPDRFPSPESSVTTTCLELAQHGPWKHIIIAQISAMYRIRHRCLLADMHQLHFTIYN